ncbi:hypothetical protein [Polyangium mundeleinium]|uniref:Uncharacterized protein n=1 Tax=Polyangium mundeleinium TaxID=2995306 RepID=A0ABT5EEY3_9BACT|nr:hypothetical protein [Polyangium mundeleinium]MDC0740374.1 hypothetical protein [Polyangium mundeleinium]
MVQRRSYRRRWAAATVIAALFLGFGFTQARRASGETPPDDGAPSGMVAFVAGGACPPGWVTVYDVAGRVVVGAIDPENVGLEVGTPLTDREERMHEHAYAGEVTLVAKNIAAANGGNHNGAAAGTYPLAGSTVKAASGLPFLQIAGCVKP